MKRIVALFAIAIAAASAAPAKEKAESNKGKRVLAGTYNSGFNDGPERVRATFVPTDEPGRWDVTFDFTFNKRQRTWHGVAEGSFDTGPLSGAVEEKDGHRVFTFALEKEKKKFKGIHAERVGEEDRKTGTLTLQ